MQMLRLKGRDSVAVGEALTNEVNPRCIMQISICHRAGRLAHAGTRLSGDTYENIPP
jgi:hypothetical protein